MLGKTRKKRRISNRRPGLLASELSILRKAHCVRSGSRVSTAPVILAFGQSHEMGFTIVTASAAFNAEEALDSALMELEHSVAMRLVAARPPKIEPADVNTPADHADLYSQRIYFRRADFFVKTGPTISLSAVGTAAPRNWKELCSRFDERGQPVIWVDLTPPSAGLHGGHTPLFAGRAIVPGLIPITFGYGQDSLASFETKRPALRHRRRSGRSTVVPCMFPHPFA